MPSNSPRATTDPWAGMRSVTQGGQMPAFSAPTHAAPASGQGGSNPFSSALFASDSGGLPGLIGMLTGAPTRQEMAQNKASEGQRQGFVGLQKRIASGMSPQAAVVDFMQSPEGQQFFTSSQDPIGALKGYLQTTQTAPDKFSLASPGQTVFNETQGTLGQHLPGAEASNVQDLATMADYTPAQTRQVADAMLQQKGAGPNGTEAERGFKTLVDQKLISPEMAAKMTSGVVSIKPTNDSLTGLPNGYIMVDMSDFLTTQNPADIHTTILGANNGGANGDGGQDLAQNTAPEVPGDIIFASGLGKAGAALGGVGGSLDADLSAPVLNKSRNQLATIFSDVTNLNGVSKQLASEVKFFTDMVDASGLTSNPGDQYQALTNLHEIVDRRMAAAGVTLHDPQAPKEIRNDSAKELYLLRKLKRDMPSQEALDSSYAKYQGGEGTIPDMIRQGAGKVGKVVDSIGNALTAGKEAIGVAEKAVTPKVPEFASEALAAKAANSGSLKPDANGKITVIINGVQRTFSQKGN